MRRRVVITGMGAITPLGHSVEALYQAQLEGRSGVGPIELFNARTFPTTFAAQVKDFELARYVSGTERWTNAGANSKFAAAASQQALADAELLESSGVDRTRFGVYLGSGEGIQDFHHMVSLVARYYRPERRAVDTVGFAKDGLHEFHPGCEAEQELHTTTAHLATHFDLQGPNYNCLTACAASSQAIGEAGELIRHGDADLMLSGGAHSMIHPFGVTGFNLLTALSTSNEDPPRASRPFDLRRDGFVLGEGAGMLVLEELEHARRRAAPIYAELTGYGSTADAFRLTDSHPDGRGAIACIQAALADSRLAPSDLGYINAHGTSTQVNDKVETLAIKKVFGDGAYEVPVSSSKSMLGHLIAAAGAVELITSIMALRRGVLPPTINYEVPDPECDLDYIPNSARERRVRHVLSNSFGFGGQNVSLIVSRFDD
ncbi:MAG TPA: beta-ketoacyl-[acyl-carrier-protein] synthase family protein [Gemmataceae bacterium]|jgi:3-oxoacyl-[acyl-carrier-protein] synthase II|nr:beta-ketoacyl-[acyl-carrier-protein] synthase family protein [Gemmataceae bacterium]